MSHSKRHLFKFWWLQSHSLFAYLRKSNYINSADNRMRVQLAECEKKITNFEILQKCIYSFINI